MVDNVEHVGAASADGMLYPCQKCQRRFRTLRGSIQHARHCRIQQHLVPDDEPPDPGQAERFYWGEEKGSQVTKDISECYDKIVYWRRNLFMLPNGGAGKNYI